MKNSWGTICKPEAYCGSTVASVTTSVGIKQVYFRRLFAKLSYVDKKWSSCLSHKIAKLIYQVMTIPQSRHRRVIIQLTSPRSQAKLFRLFRLTATQSTLEGLSCTLTSMVNCWSLSMGKVWKMPNRICLKIALRLMRRLRHALMTTGKEKTCSITQRRLEWSKAGWPVATQLRATLAMPSPTQWWRLEGGRMPPLASWTTVESGNRFKKPLCWQLFWAKLLHFYKLQKDFLLSARFLGDRNLYEANVLNC